jgi:hypothetical protein
LSLRRRFVTVPGACVSDAVADTVAEAETFPPLSIANRLYA